MIAVHQQEFTDLRLSVAGIIFLGAPFQGSDVAAFGKLIAQLLGRDDKLLKSLEKNNQGQLAISRDFWGSFSNWDIICFYENIATEYGPLKAQVCQHSSLHTLYLISIYRLLGRSPLLS